MMLSVIDHSSIMCLIDTAFVSRFRTNHYYQSSIRITASKRHEDHYIRSLYQQQVVMTRYMTSKSDENDAEMNESRRLPIINECYTTLTVLSISD